jgi:hypothetical protein
MKKNIALVVLIIMALLMFGCTSDERNYVEKNPGSSSSNSNTWLSELGALTRVPVLFGVGGGLLTAGQVRSKGAVGRSSLYWINTTNGSATLIGDIGYFVEGIAYDAITNKLYGITSGYGKTTEYWSQLIEIDMATGEGTIIGPITVEGSEVDANFKQSEGLSFSQPSFNLSGTLYAVNNTDHQLCTINVTNAEADCFSVTGDSYIGVDQEFRGQAFDNIDVLNLIVPGASKASEYKDDDDDLVAVDDDDSSGGARIYSFDMANKEFNYQRTVYGLPYNMAPNGDFDPSTGMYWGLDSLKYYGDDDDDAIASDDDDDFATKNLLMININEGTLVQTIPTQGNLHAITFGYLDASTLIKMGLNDLIEFLCPNNPE